MHDGIKDIWLDHLPRLHAEKSLRFDDLSELSIDGIRELTFLATDDKYAADKIAMNAYQERLEASVVNE